MSVVKADHVNCASKFYTGCIYANTDNRYILVDTPKKYLEAWQFAAASLHKSWTAVE